MWLFIYLSHCGSDGVWTGTYRKKHHQFWLARKHRCRIAYSVTSVCIAALSRFRELVCVIMSALDYHTSLSLFLQRFFSFQHWLWWNIMIPRCFFNIQCCHAFFSLVSLVTSSTFSSSLLLLFSPSFVPFLICSTLPLLCLYNVRPQYACLSFATFHSCCFVLVRP